MKRYKNVLNNTKVSVKNVIFSNVADLRPLGYNVVVVISLIVI